MLRRAAGRGQRPAERLPPAVQDRVAVREEDDSGTSGSTKTNSSSTAAATQPTSSGQSPTLPDGAPGFYYGWRVVHR
jgi:hypothetical protein